MLADHIAQIDVGDGVAVGKQHIFRVVMSNKADRALERLETAAVNAAGLTGEWGNDHKAANLARKVPCAARADMVHQGLIIAFCDDANILNIGIDHCGEHKIDQTVAAAERHGTGGAAFRQLSEHTVVHVGENDPHYLICSHVVTAPPQYPAAHPRPSPAAPRQAHPDRSSPWASL